MKVGINSVNIELKLYDVKNHYEKDIITVATFLWRGIYITFFSVVVWGCTYQIISCLMFTVVACMLVKLSPFLFVGLY